MYYSFDTDAVVAQDVKAVGQGVLCPHFAIACAPAAVRAPSATCTAASCAAAPGAPARAARRLLVCLAQSLLPCQRAVLAAITTVRLAHDA